MPKRPFYSYFELLNIRQQLREIDPHIYDDLDSLGIYAREFRLTQRQTDTTGEMLR